MPRRRLPHPTPLDGIGTLASKQVLADPALRRRDGWIAYATRTGQGPATIVITAHDRALEAEAWGSGADSLLARLPALVGLEDAGAEGFAPEVEPLRSLRRRHPGLRIPRTGAVLEALVPAILGQKVLGKEASWSYERLTRAHGEPAPGPAELGLRLPPQPDTLAELGYESFHPFGIERRRAELIRLVAKRRHRLEEIAAMELATARQRLLSIRGIGEWTAALVLRTACGDADAVPVGDYNLPALVAWNLAGERRADDTRMLELLEPWRGHRARVIQLLHTGGTKPPRRGPRLPFRSIERE